MKRPTLSLISSIILLCALSGCVTTNSADPNAYADEGLQYVVDAPVDFAYIQPGYDFGRYSKIAIEPLNLDNVSIVEPVVYNPRVSSSWQLTDANKAELQRLFASAAEKYLNEEKGFELVAANTADSLVIYSQLVAIYPAAPKDDFVSRPAFRMRYITDGAGSMTIAVALVDANSKEVVARFSDTQTDRGMGVNDRFNNSREVRRAFSGWARNLTDWLVSQRQPSE